MAGVKVIILGVDIETSGPNVNRNAPFALASVFLDGDTLEPIAEFSKICHLPTWASWDADTSAHFYNDTSPEWKEKVAQFARESQGTVYEPTHMVRDWYWWTQQVLVDIRFSFQTHRLIPISDTSAFDTCFLSHYLPEDAKGMEYITGRYCAWQNVKSYLAGRLNIDLSLGIYTTRHLLDMVYAENDELRKVSIGLPGKRHHHCHDPLEDVRCIVGEYARLRLASNLIKS